MRHRRGSLFLLHHVWSLSYWRSWHESNYWRLLHSCLPPGLRWFEGLAQMGDQSSDTRAFHVAGAYSSSGGHWIARLMTWCLWAYECASLQKRWKPHGLLWPSLRKPIVPPLLYPIDKPRSKGRTDFISWWREYQLLWPWFQTAPEEWLPSETALFKYCG